MRPSLRIETRPESGEPRVVIIDTPPDFRAQCLRFMIRRVDAVLYTHAHADHVFGLDDLRLFNFRQGTEIPCYGSETTLQRLRMAFGYVFDGMPSEGGGKPSLLLVPVRDPFVAAGLVFEPVPVQHGSLEVFGYRFGDFAYVTDVSAISDDSFEALAGVHTLILGALRYRPHPTHFSVEEAVRAAERIGAARTYLTHMNHDIDYSAPAVDLPPGVEFAYDGLSFDI
ncbi:MAG: MBL fold metallo-hydrolase [Thermoanaerobaculia bacterium]|nr:MBL fold metallo-hydrolase [Thermoanaerobaculia bacterium]